MEKLGGVAKRVGTRSDNLRADYFCFIPFFAIAKSREMHKCCVAQRGLYATEVNKASDFVSDGVANSLTWTPHPACFVARRAPLDNIHVFFQGVGHVLPLTRLRSNSHFWTDTYRSFELRNELGVFQFRNILFPLKLRSDSHTRTWIAAKRCTGREPSNRIVLVTS